MVSHACGALCKHYTPGINEDTDEKIPFYVSPWAIPFSYIRCYPYPAHYPVTQCCFLRTSLCLISNKRSRNARATITARHPYSSEERIAVFNTLAQHAPLKIRCGQNLSRTTQYINILHFWQVAGLVKMHLKYARLGEMRMQCIDCNII